MDAQTDVLNATSSGQTGRNEPIWRGRILTKLTDIHRSRFWDIPLYLIEGYYIFLISYSYSTSEREEEGERTIVAARGDRLECQDKPSHSRSTLSWMGTQSVKGRPTIDWRNTNWKRINKTMEFSMSHTSKSISCRWKGVKQGMEVGLFKWNVRMANSCKLFKLIRMIH